MYRGKKNNMNMLGVFVKQPVLGKVKTRLGADIGVEYATSLYTAFQSDIIDRFREMAETRFLCYAPNETAAKDYFSGQGRGGYQLWLQPDVSLGERMHQFFCYAFAHNAQRVVVIGSDSPTLPEKLIQEAFDCLEESDCVIGPATDGGFYLIGQRTEARPLFDGIEWSHATVLSQMVRKIKQANATLSLLSPWYDVDREEDLQFLEGHLKALQQTNHLSHMNRTIQAIETGQGGRTAETSLL